METITHSDDPTPVQMLDQTLDMVAGLSILILPLFPLAIPGVILLGIVLIPLAAVGLVAALVGGVLASPYLLVRALRRRAPE
jgi:hypothetical protein